MRADLLEEAKRDAEDCIALATAMANGDRSDMAASFEIADFAGKLARHVLSLVEILAAQQQGVEGG